jgi:hypothetical protein
MLSKVGISPEAPSPPVGEELENRNFETVETMQKLIYVRYGVCVSVVTETQLCRDLLHCCLRHWNSTATWNSILSFVLTFVPEFLLLFLIADVVGNEAMSGGGSDMVV